MLQGYKKRKLFYPLIYPKIYPLIYPEIYPELIASKQFLVDLFPVEVVSLDGEINTTLYNYQQKHQKFAWWVYPIIWVKKLVKLIKGEESASGGVADAPNPFMLPKHQNAVAEAIKANILCAVDKKTGVITLRYTAQDALISATVVNVIKDKLQQHIVDYRTCKARNDLKYFEALCNIFDKKITDLKKNNRKYFCICD